MDSEVKKWKNINFGDVRDDVRGGIIWKLGGKEREDQKEKIWALQKQKNITTSDETTSLLPQHTQGNSNN